MTMKLNWRKVYIERTVQGFAEVLAYGGGIFSAILPAFFLLLFIYNRHFYELKISEVLFRHDSKENTIKNISYSYFHFLKYLVYLLLTDILCFKIDWPDCYKLKKIFDTINYKIDIGLAIKRIDEKSKDSFEVLCPPMRLSDSEFLSKVQEYYNIITKD